MPQTRQREIINLLNRHTRMSVKELSEKLFVCEMTIRRDLKALEADGYLKRYNGGAIIFSNEAQVPISERKILHSKEKMRLAERAVPYADGASTVFIDSSSTCMHIIPLLAEKKDIRIITNSIQSLHLAEKYHIPCTIVGGDYYEKDMCTVGTVAIDMLESINIDIAFFTSHAYSDDGIISDYDVAQTAIRKAVIKRAERSVFIFLKSKLHKKATYILCKAEDVYKVICE